MGEEDKSRRQPTTTANAKPANPILTRFLLDLLIISRAYQNKKVTETTISQDEPAKFECLAAIFYSKSST